MNSDTDSLFHAVQGQDFRLRGKPWKAAVDQADDHLYSIAVSRLFSSEGSETAVKYLGLFGSESEINILTRVVKCNQFLPARKLAIRAIMSIGGPLAVAALDDLCEHEDDEIADLAAYAHDEVISEGVIEAGIGHVHSAARGNSQMTIRNTRAAQYNTVAATAVFEEYRCLESAGTIRELQRQLEML